MGIPFSAWFLLSNNKFSEKNGEDSSTCRILKPWLFSFVFVQIFERTFRCKEPVFFEVKLKICNALIGVSESPPSKTSWEWVMKAENICMPGTQMTLSLIGKGLVLERSTPQTKDKQVPGMFNPKYGEKLSPFAGLHLLSSLFAVAVLLRVYVQWFWPYHFGPQKGCTFKGPPSTE